MQDILAWVILMSIWVFGVPVIFTCRDAKYKVVLTGWVLVNIVTALMLVAIKIVIWALIQVLN